MVIFKDCICFEIVYKMFYINFGNQNMTLQIGGTIVTKHYLLKDHIAKILSLSHFSFNNDTMPCQVIA